MPEREIPPHPRQEPEWPGELTWEAFRAVWVGCADFSEKEVRPAGWERGVQIGWLEGMVRGERLCDYVLRPLARYGWRPGMRPTKALLQGGVWNQSVTELRTLDEAVQAAAEGCCVLFLPDGVLSCSVATEEKRAVSPPENESEGKGAKDAFVESVRTNTSLVRRRLRSARLKVHREVVGRQSKTPVEVLWLEHLADPALPREIIRRINAIEEDGLLQAAELEEYLTDPKRSVFPRILFTERPDRFCRGLLDGRVGIFADGLPLGALMPGELSRFLKAPQDQSQHWLAASVLRALRWLCLLITLLLPGFYIAVADFHPELIPTELARSIIASEQEVPFPTAAEVLGLLASFEILQEAGLRLPKTIGQTVSIIGGLVVGQAAVDAKIVSPVVVIVVAVAGIAGFTMPDQDLANALRLWRFLLSFLACLGGVYPLTLGAAMLIAHLASLEDLGVPYLTWPERSGEPGILLRPPVREENLRPLWLHPRNRRRRR